MHPPLIGVTTSVDTQRSPERAYVNSPYLHAVQRAGGVPVLLPPQLDPGARAALVERLDGVLLTGGGDVDPARYGQARHPTADDVSEARDALELWLTRQVLERPLALLAICRGVQVLNVALGGSLCQDIPSVLGSPIVHRQTEPRHEPTHHVKIEPGSRLAGILGALEVDVNSFHHQSIERLGTGLRTVAVASDGVIEGVELAGAEAFAIGVQWHPEELVPHDPTARNLFAALVGAADRRPHS
jgi:putative glutamine amidotransferase